MSNLASINTAMRVREVIKRQAIGTIDRNVPRALTGRVVSVDLSRQTARVWFIGDEQPIQVKLFSSTIPGQWQAQLQPGLTDSTNLAGYGSMVSCQRLNGELYITDVLTGGQFSYDLKTMNQKFVATYPYAYSVNSVFGEVISYKTHFTIVADAVQGQSVEFGPFIKTEGSAASPWVKIDVDFGIGGATYEFSMPSGQFWDGSQELDRWFRILPVREVSANNSSQYEYYDLDVCIKNTQYGLDPNTNQQSNEYWFRLVARSIFIGTISADFSVETNLFDKARSIDGNEVLVQTVVTLPPEIAGYVGFHNSEMNVFDLYDTKVRDRFDRTLSATWGTADDGTTWTGSGGSDSNYTVSGNRGNFLATSAATTYQQVNSRTEYDHDILVKISPTHLATGGPFHAFVVARRTASNNYYYCTIVFNTTGQVDFQLRKNVAGAVTLLQSTTSVTSYSASSSVWVRFQIRNNKLRGKLWNAGVSQPDDWTLTQSTDTSITTAGAFAFMVDRNGLNTNSTLAMSFSEIDNNITGQARFSSGGWATGPWRSTRLRLASELQKTWTCTSGFTWDNTTGALGWTGEILLSGLGLHYHGLAEGSMYISCPKNAAEYVIPVFGLSNPTTIAVNTSGVPIAAGRSLYVAIPPGERNVDLLENLFLVDSSSSGNSFEVPEWAVLIAHRQLGTSLVRLGNGLWAGAESVEVLTTDTSALTNNAAYSATAGFAGATVCGTTFIAPQSGKVDIKWSGEILNVSSFSLLSVELREGSTVGSGTVVFGPDDNHTARNDGTLSVGCHQSKMITGLTPGAVYNIRTMHRTNSTNGTFGRRKIWIHPAS